MRLDLAVAVPAVLVATIAATTVTARIVTAPTPPVLRRATPDEKQIVAGIIGGDEMVWANQSVQAFPEDHWSARDDFHGREWRRVREIAGERAIPIEDVLRAIDDDLHRVRATADAPDWRATRAVPCKPRPIYD